VVSWTETDEGEIDMSVTGDIAAQAEWQQRRYGEWNEQMPDGTGPDVEWLAPVVRQATAEALYGDEPMTPFHADKVEALLRGEWDFPKDGTPDEQEAAAGACTWMRILREEVAEAFGAETPEALRAELVQIAAVARNWAETIDRRSAP
jgi:hypothetical protein